MNSVKKISYGIAATLIASAPLTALGANFVPAGTGLPAGSIIGIVTNLMNWLLLFIGILGVIGFIIAGILYLTAAGDEEQIEKAKNAMVYSIIGIIVALLGVIVLQAAQGFLGAAAPGTI